MRECKTLEFKENIETNSFLKTISAFANYIDGKIIFGISDDGAVKGVSNPVESCLNLENKINDAIKPVPFYTLEINDDNTITLEVKKGSYTPYLYKGKDYKRNDTSTIEVDRLELNRLTLEGMNMTYEEQISFKQNLSFTQLQKELTDKIGTKKISVDILKTLGLMKDGKYNNAASLVADENQFLGIDIIRYGDTINELMDRYIGDNISIFQMYHDAIDFYQKYYTYEKIDGSQRTNQEIIPYKAFREALANALVHRLWDVNSRIRISMYKDKIEITSPGGLPSALNKNEYLNSQVSFLRNPIIGNIFFRLGYIEMFGSGIKRIKDSYNDYQVAPDFLIYENSITVILPAVNITVNITDDERMILEIISLEKLSRLQLEKRGNLSKSKTSRILNSLCEKGFIQKTGSGPNTKYSIRNKNY